MDKRKTNGTTIAIADKSVVERFLNEMKSGSISEIKPLIDLEQEAGFTYPKLEHLLEITTAEVKALLEMLANEHILVRSSFHKLTACPRCHNPNLKSISCCPKCGSQHITTGRILEHFSCGNVATEDEYKAHGDYVCPKCMTKIKFLGTDYRSLGANHICYDCRGIFSKAVDKLYCVKCMFAFDRNEALEEELYSYRMNGGQGHHDWVDFELKIKKQFIELLEKSGYDIMENVNMKSSGSKSGVEHTLSMLARRDNGLIVNTLGIGIIFNSEVEEIGLEEVFRFDEKAFDLGIHDKLIIAMPKLSRTPGYLLNSRKLKCSNTGNWNSIWQQ